MEKNNKETIKKALLSFQNIYGYSQVNLAEKIGINALLIKNYLSGKANAKPSLESLLKISNYFGTSIDYFLFGKKNKFINSIKLFKLGEKIDEAHEFSNRYQIEATISLYLQQQFTKSVFDPEKEYLLTENICSNIKILRKSNIENTQENFAKKLGLQRTHISQYERNVKPPFNTLFEISKMFNISVHYLVTGKPCFFKFNNTHLLDKLLILDHTADFNNIKTIIEIMQKIIDNNNIK